MAISNNTSLIDLDIITHPCAKLDASFAYTYIAAEQATERKTWITVSLFVYQL